MFALELTNTQTKCTPPTLEDSAILREFWDVFLKEILGLLTKWDIDFTINLVLGFALVSKSPYQMRVLELTELEI